MRTSAWWETTVTDWDSGQDVLRRRRYGVIETRGGRLWSIRLRPFPKLIAWPEIALQRAQIHAHDSQIQSCEADERQ